MDDSKKNQLDISDGQNEVNGVSTEGEEQEQTCRNMLDDKHVLNHVVNLYLSPMFSLPKSARRLVRALKAIQTEHVHKEAEFFKELHALEIKYESLKGPLYEKRAAIVSGSYIPTDEECNFHSDKELKLSNEFQQMSKLENGADKETGEPIFIDIKGIPYFWLTAFKSAPPIEDMIEEHDEPILKHLIDVRATTCLEPMSYTLEFHFEPNEYFTNSVLTKHYELKCAPDESDIFAFEGPEVIKAKGCSIDWKKGKNVTQKVITARQKYKARGAIRTVTNLFQNKSFFNFFNPPTVAENGAVDENTLSILSNDIVIGNIFKEKLIPYAVLFFTGDNIVDEEFYEEDDKEESFESLDEEEDEDESDD